MLHKCRRLVLAGPWKYLKYNLATAWAKVPQGPIDPVLILTEAFAADECDNKVNLGVGAYRDERGNPWVLPSVRMACGMLHEKQLDKEYLAIQGDSDFCKAGLELALGKDHPRIKNNQIISVQTVSGTSSLSIGGVFLYRFYPGPKTIYLPKPTWVNHDNIFKHSGLKVDGFKYMDTKTYGLDLRGMLGDLEKIPEMSIVLLHACAQNPTGVDPTQEQWKEIAQVFVKRKLFPYFDMAYQGFASGDTDKDAFPVRHFMERGLHCALSTSFSRNMGLYGERVGAISFTTDGKEEGARVLSQLKAIIRPRYSNPPINGMRIALEIFRNKDLYVQWKKDISTMADRLKGVRKKLKDQLKKEGSSKNWEHITKQVGMFCYTGLNSEQVERLIKEYHIYLTSDGRISVAGLCKANLPYVAQAIHDVTKNLMDQGHRALSLVECFGDFIKTAILCRLGPFYESHSRVLGLFVKPPKEKKLLSDSEDPTILVE